MPHARQGQPELVLAVVKRGPADVAECHMFEVAPDQLDRMQVRGRARHAVQRPPCGATRCQHGRDDAAAMEGRTIPNHEDLARNMLQQLLEKAHPGLTPLRGPLHAH